jgi:hypothetical protein
MGFSDRSSRAACYLDIDTRSYLQRSWGITQIMLKNTSIVHWFRRPRPAYNRQRIGDAGRASAFALRSTDRYFGLGGLMRDPEPAA